MKRTSKFFLAGVVVIMAVCLSFGMTMGVAFAENRVFDDRFDSSFEEFGDLTGDITATGMTLEKPYLHVEFTAADSGTADDPIFKEGKGMDSASVVNIVFEMRAPKGDVTLDELMYGSRYGDQHQVYSKPLSELKDANGDDLPALTTEWQKYVINYALSYEDEEVYNNTDGTPSENKVNDGRIVGVHLFAAAGASGTIEINKVYKTSNESGDEETDAASNLINGFTGGKTVDATMSGGWWAGSARGYIVQPNVLTAGTTLTVKHTNKTAGDFRYAVVEATGDVENLKVSFAAADDAFGAAATVVSGETIEVQPETCQFKFEYDGETSAQVDRIFYTNLEVPATTGDPLPDLANAKVLDDFSLAQATIGSDYDAAIAMPGLEDAGIFYRLSYSTDKNVKVENGAAVFEATTDYINLKIQARELTVAKYVLLKMKVENGATLDNFRFSLTPTPTASPSIVYYNDLKRDSTRKVNALKESTLYTGGEWDYLIVDIAESKLFSAGGAVDTIDLYWTGTGRLYIDEILLADDVYNETSVYKNEESAALFTFTPNPSAGDPNYLYAGYWFLNDADMRGNVLALELTKLDDDTSFDNLRLAFVDSLTIWGGGDHNTETDKMIILTNGQKLSDVTFVTNEPQTVYIDLVASGITKAKECHVHTSNTATGPFKVTRIEVLNRALATDSFNEEEYFGFEDDLVVAADTTAYTYVGYAGNLSKAQGKYLSVTVEAGEKDVDLTNVRFEFTAGGGLRWFGANDAGRLLDKDGNPFEDLTVEAGTTATFVIDLEKSGVKPGDFHIHADAINQVTFKNTRIYKTAYEVYLEANDETAPELTVTAPETAEKGAQVEVQAAVKDNAYAGATYEVSVKLGEEDIAFAEGKFTAEKAGTYTVTVTAQDAYGNETTVTKQITVADEQQPGGQTPSAPSDQKPADKKTNVGAIVGGVVGGVAGVALIVAIVLIVLKKKRIA